ncbi:response regulator [Paenibacillus glycanilyticus]|uniref:response regulator n=1 Tax=Paenibacillus glycanilyticus TaxID=126569 RepID=UPI00203B13CC|nr:helix-turn-helix domain-containing protein [Paenibacillus glycanilyticus]MCM3629854.1 response regulator [Paenibacillus glycanilyticus]
MLRLLIVDDEDIITDSLYEVFHGLLPEKLDVCKAYSAKEALQWMSRTRIDIVLTDISMPGMNGLELSEEIQSFWPRCKVIFLTGFSEFDYAYKAIQMPKVRYLLKTEGYDKVTSTVLEVMDEIEHENEISGMLEQSREQLDLLEQMAQGDYIRHLLQESEELDRDARTLSEEFRRMNISLNPTVPVWLVRGHLSFPEGDSYIEKSHLLTKARMVCNSYLSEKMRQVGIVDKHGDLLWLLQPSDSADEKFHHHSVRYLEGTLEFMQETCLQSLGLPVAFIISIPTEWKVINRQYERLRQLQLMNIDKDATDIILRDRGEQAEDSAEQRKDEGHLSPKAELLTAFLEAGKAERFRKIFDELTQGILQANRPLQRNMEVYYSIALVLFSYISRSDLCREIPDYGKLMRLDEHSSMKEAIQYLKQVSDKLFQAKASESVIENICEYINEHLNEDLSLVRLADINYFNPTYLSRFFKQERGLNLSEYIDNCRLRRAKELLKEDHLKIREVAVEVGYEAAHSFTRFFKKATGLTPQEYRDALTYT